MTSPALRKILDAYLEHYDSLDDAAEPLGITGSRVSRIRKGEHAPDVITCLRLAKAGGFPPGAVLRAAGKGETADLLEELYGKAAPALPDRQARDLIRRRSSLPPDVRAALDGILRALAGS
jgi:hypothetical protein